MSDMEAPVTYWAFWHNASGSGIRADGPFAHREDAVRHIQETLGQWGAQLEHGTGAAGEWRWDPAHQVWTLYRGDYEIPLGYYVIEQVVPDARTDDDHTDPVETAAQRAASRVATMTRENRFDLFVCQPGVYRTALARNTSVSDATRILGEAVARWDDLDERSWEAQLEEHDGAMTHVWTWNKQTASWDPGGRDDTHSGAPSSR